MHETSCNFAWKAVQKSDLSGKEMFVVALVDAERLDLFVEGVEDLEFGVQEVV